MCTSVRTRKRGSRKIRLPLFMKSWQIGCLFFADSRNREIEQLTVEIIHREQHWIAARIKVLLYQTENLYIPVTAHLYRQRISRLRDGQAGIGAADEDTLAALKLGKQ